MEESLVVFWLDEQRYALLVDRVQRCLRIVAITPLPEAPSVVMGIVNLGGVVVPVINIRQRFNHQPREILLSDQLLIATTRRRTIALVVDETIGVLKVASDRIAGADAVLSRQGLVDGAVRMEDGLVLINDLERLLSIDEEIGMDRVLDGVSPHHEKGCSA